MNSYLVGGAVRDRLLGLDPKERDWVVVGESPESMVANGFTAVGQFFPVFLHPDTKEEYALARLERSTGPGYGDFEVDTAEDVSLEDDLKRRDLTINAIAQDSEGHLIDPYGGQADLARRRAGTTSAPGHGIGQRPQGPQRCWRRRGNTFATPLPDARSVAGWIDGSDRPSCREAARAPPLCSLSPDLPDRENPAQILVGLVPQWPDVICPYGRLRCGIAITI